MECTPNEEKGTDYFSIITNLFNYFSLGIDDKVTAQAHSPGVQKSSTGANPHQRNSIQQIVYNLKLKRTSDLKISTRFGLDPPVTHNRKGFEKERQEQDKVSNNVHATKCEEGENRRNSSTENCLNGSGERRKKKKKKKNSKNRDNQYTSSFDLSGGEFFQLKEQSANEDDHESKVDKHKEKRKKKSKKQKSKREKEKKKTKEKTAEPCDAADNVDDSELEWGREGTKRNGGCDKTREDDEAHREEETVNFADNEKGGVCVQEETTKKKKMRSVKKTKKKKTRREEKNVNETSSTENDFAENGSAPMKPARLTSELKNTSNTKNRKHNNTTLSSSFVQPPWSSTSDEANLLHVVDEADSQITDFKKAQDELAINYISDSKKSYISIRSSNRHKNNVIQLPKLNLSTRGDRSSSGEENETTDGGGDDLTPVAQMGQ
ncbi:hypothetical protein AK88_00405 [Plasmodium fragile]|uniref:Uncharacterized protein n=1 Tax=Plasmodium fragile TaxID=5857 RepID=A0A0D9QS97_PLAFR|nr:uncharacterized protein AK88_00405 [Plasmodium fragile]KJP89949.1 hypothetical protein AK88_00405 [Plasmodium fragile]